MVKKNRLKKVAKKTKKKSMPIHIWQQYNGKTMVKQCEKSVNELKCNCGFKERYVYLIDDKIKLEWQVIADGMTIIYIWPNCRALYYGYEND